MAREYTLSLRDGHGDYTEIALTEEQARAFMAGTLAVPYWPGSPESVTVDGDMGWITEHHDARAPVHEEQT